MSENKDGVHPLSEKQALTYSYRYVSELRSGLDLELKKIKARLEEIVEESEVVDYGHVYAQWEVMPGPINLALLRREYPEVDETKIRNSFKKLVVRSRMANPKIQSLINPIGKTEKQV